MSHAALHHAVNGFFDAFRSKPVPAAPVSRAARVRVESRYNEDDDESLLEAATSLPRGTLKALEKQLRTDGFKGSQVSGWSQGQRGGFTVHYGGEKYEFEISENVTPRSVGEIGRAVKASGRYSQNGRGIYHETPAGKHDMVLHQDHRGSWRIDLVTSAGGNHLDVTGPNRGYGSAEEAFQAALDVQRTRGIRGKSHVYVADRDGNLSDYEPMETNGRGPRARTTFTSRAPEGAIDDDYVVGNVDRDANIGLFQVRRGRLLPSPIGVSADMGEIVRLMEQDASSRGLFGPAVFQSNDDGSWTHVGNVVNGRYQESGDYQGNGRRMDPRTGARVPSPRFAAGDRVVRDDGSARGEVAIVGNYDETIGGYRYKVQQDSGGRIWWNESSMRQEGHSANGRPTVVDAIAARELDLYIANTHELVGASNSIGKSIDTNLKRKLASGKYDSALAPKAWQHLVDAGAKRYEREFGDSSPVFNAATRRQVAADFARAWEEENGVT